MQMSKIFNGSASQIINTLIEEIPTRKLDKLKNKPDWMVERIEKNNENVIAGYRESVTSSLYYVSWEKIKEITILLDLKTGRSRASKEQAITDYLVDLAESTIDLWKGTRAANQRKLIEVIQRENPFQRLLDMLDEQDF